MSVAAPEGGGWRLRTEPVGEVGTLLGRLRSRAGRHPAVLGVDAPIGVPVRFARLHLEAWRDFPHYILSRAADDELFRVCATLDEVGPGRPFFPLSVRGAPRRAGQAARLGVDHHDELLRRCDLRTADRPRAACMFWTLGPNQVGKAALSLWRELLPTVPRGCLWPYDGSLAALLDRRGFAVAETYPAQSMRQLRLPIAGSKRRQADRAALAGPLAATLAALGARLDPSLAGMLEGGFGSDAAGEDRFDSFVGLLGLLQVLCEPALDRVPADPAVRWEGWILGQE